MNEQRFKELFKDVKDVNMLFTIVSNYQKTKMFSLRHPQKLLVQEAHVFIGLGKLNLSCGSCIARGLNKIIQYSSTYIPNVDYTIKPQVTKKKVAKKAEAKTEEQPDFKKMHFSTLKAIAEKTLKKKYKKGTSKKDILKDLGVE